MARDELVIGIDVGTTSIKGGLYTITGEALAAATMACETVHPSSGRAEQAPQQWLRSIQSVLTELSTDAEPNAVAAVGICSQVNTHVFVDADLEPIAPAITWQDQRCADVSAALQAQAEQGKLDIAIDSSALLCRAEWFRQERPDDWQRTRWILSPKDYCIARLTGAVASDALSSIGLVTQDGRYIESLDLLVPDVSRRLPPLREPADVLGSLDIAKPPTSCPVVVGTMDAWACLYGSGCLEAGDAFEIAGTSEIIGALSATGTPGHGVVSFPPQRGVALFAGPTQCGGDSLAWLAGLLRLSISETLNLVVQRTERGDPLLFLPHLLGERAPLWNPQARGAFVGLSKTHGAGQLVRAVLEGVGFSARQLREAIEAAVGFDLASLRISGGGARSDLWCQIKADIHDRPLHRVANVDTGSFGAALLAAVGVGAYPDIAAAARDAVRIERRFLPDANRRRRYDALFRLYRRSYAGLEGVFAELAQHSAGSLQ